MMKRESNYNKVLFLTFICLCVATCAIIVVDLLCQSGVEIQGKAKNYNEGWTVEYGADVEENIKFPCKVNNLTNNLTFYNILSGIKGNRYIMFYSSHSKVEVYVDDVLRYTYGDETTSVYGNTPGNSFNFIPLSDADNGKVIKIHIQSVYNEYEQLCPDIIIGDSRACEAIILRRDVINMLAGMIIFMIGIVIISLYIFVSKLIRADKPFAYLGIYCVMMGLWSISKFSIWEFISEHAFNTETITYTIVNLSTIVMTMFWREVISKRFEKVMNVLILVNIIQYIAALLLHVLGIVDLYESDAVKVTCFAITMLIAILFTIFDYKSIKMVGREKIVLGMPILALGQMFDYLIERFTYIQYNELCYKFAIIIYMSIPISILTTEIIDKINLARQVGNYQKIAYTDALTSVGNRAAFDTELSSIHHSDYFKYSIVNMDVNDLKKTNDLYGHDSGDNLIIIAAKAIAETFGPYGKCFRTGGDEFVAVLYKVDEKLFEKLISNMRKYLDTVRVNDKVIGVRVAAGYAEYMYDKDVDLYSTYKRADEKMYENKRIMKGLAPNGDAIFDIKITEESLPKDNADYQILVDDDAYRRFIDESINKIS